MGIPFNADEVFEMAEQMERNGAKFYRKAAEGAVTPQVKEVILGFAAMEDEHLRTFAAMREQLTAHEEAPTAFDPDGEAASYLRAMADDRVFDTKADPSAELTGREGDLEVLRTALQLEKDSIVFYLGIKDLVPEHLGRGGVERIIKEEMRHVQILNKEIASIG